MCPLKGDAVPMLLAALDAGGKQAVVAVAALHSFGACVDDQARMDARDALINSLQLNNRTVVMRCVRVCAWHAMLGGWRLSMLVIKRQPRVHGAWVGGGASNLQPCRQWALVVPRSLACNQHLLPACPCPMGRYAYRYIQACNANGIACCTTVAVVDPDTQQVLYSKDVHTSNSSGTTAGTTGGTEGPQPTPSPVEPPQPTEADSGVNAGAVAGAVVGVVAALALTAGLIVWLRRRRKQQVAAGTAAGAASDPKLSSKAGMSSTGRATGSSGLCHLSDDAAAAALATVPTKPGGSTPASLESLLQGLEEMEGGGVAYSAGPEDAYLLSYVTSLVSGCQPTRHALSDFEVVLNQLVCMCAMRPCLQAVQFPVHYACIPSACPRPIPTGLASTGRHREWRCSRGLGSHAPPAVFHSTAAAAMGGGFQRSASGGTPSPTASPTTLSGGSGLTAST